MPETTEHSETPPPFNYEAHGLRLQISAHARRVALAEGAPNPRASWIYGGSRTIGDTVLAALQRKARRYGILPAPYVIAVNCMESFAGLDDAIAALFGAPVVGISRDTEGREVMTPGRTGVGLWGDAEAPRATRVSAVLATEALDPWTLARRGARIIHNPWATNPLPDTGSRLPQGIVNEQEELVLSNGELWRQIFDLYEGWPGNEGEGR